MKYLGKSALLAVLWLAMSPAYAAMVTTPELAAKTEHNQLEVGNVQRQQVQRQLIELGIEPSEAAKRVNQMTDQQISNLKGEITDLPAGAGVGTTNLLLIIILLLLII